MKNFFILFLLSISQTNYALVTISNPKAIPDNLVVISQQNTNGLIPIQSRNFGGSDTRMITQTFHWQSNQKMDGLGLFLANEPGNNWTASQNYVLVIQAIDNNNMPTLTVAQVEFLLDKKYMKQNSWLYIDITNDISLASNQWYGFTFCPTISDVNTSLRAYWALSDTRSFPGNSTQDSPFKSGLPKTNAYKNSKPDFTFYITESAPEISLSNPSFTIKENITIFQTNNLGAQIQSRNFRNDGSDWRGITQTFKWNTNKKFNGLGLMFGNSQFTWETDQEYELTIQELNANVPVLNVADIKFTLTADKVHANQWLYLRTYDIQLKKDHWYGFTLCPPSNSVNSTQRAYWATASSGSIYPGRGAQFNPRVSGLPKTDIYGSAGTDFAFYLTAASRPWIFAGNELEIVADTQTKKTVRYLTNGESIDTQFHYHNGSWGEINGTNYLFFSSSRNRPEGAVAPEGDRQIMAVNPDNGNIYYLTTIPNYGSDLSTRPYFCSYNDFTKCIYFFDKSRKQICVYDVQSSAQKILYTLPPNAISRELDDFADDNSIRIIYPYTIQDGSLSRGYIAVTDFDSNWNFITNIIVKECTTNDALNHVGICPKNKNVFFYKHHKDRLPDGKYEKTELWLMNLSTGTDTQIHPDDHYIDHMIWGASGKYIYWDDNAGRLYCYEWETGKTNICIDEYTVHNQVSTNENLWVYDKLGSVISSTNINGRTVENRHGSIKIFNCENKTAVKLANIIWAAPHPRHPHPRFSQDDSMISFVTGASCPNTRLAIMYLDEIEIESNKLNFGEIETDSFKTMNLPIRNLGAFVRTGSVFNSSSVFSLTNYYVVDALTTTNLAVKFAPSSIQRYTNVITITTTDADINDNIKVTLIGTGVPEPLFSLFIVYCLCIKAVGKL